jgi:hypothetical protein
MWLLNPLGGLPDDFNRARDGLLAVPGFPAGAVDVFDSVDMDLKTDKKVAIHIMLALGPHGIAGRNIDENLCLLDDIQMIDDEPFGISWLRQDRELLWLMHEDSDDIVDLDDLIGIRQDLAATLDVRWIASGDDE